MTREELMAFKEQVADPAMQRLVKNTSIDKGTCYIDNLEIFLY